MQARILSLNIGGPAAMEWNGKSVQSSMRKIPVDGPLVVGPLSIEGDSFAKPAVHGTPDSVVYAFGQTSALEFVRRLGRDTYSPGEAGENLTLDVLDEKQVSVGDLFQVGSTLLQATFPRIPCGKVNFRFCHPEGQKAMQETGRSGIYFRVLKPGRISRADVVERVEPAREPISIYEVYDWVVRGNAKWSTEARRRMLTNGALPRKVMDELLSATNEGVF